MRSAELFVALPEFRLFISERYKIAIKRQNDLPKPWSKDPIFQQYRFCNIFREWDTVTQWIAKNWREPNDGDPDLWFAMVVARLINWPETLERIGYPVPFRPVATLRTLRLRKADGNKVFTGAYMIRSDKMPKDEYIVDRVLQPLWDFRSKIRPQPLEPLQAFYERLVRCPGLGSFLAAQIVADMKYTPVFQGAADWWTFAAPGPGSKRGLNRLVGVEPEDNWDEENWLRTLAALHRRTGHVLILNKIQYPFHAQDLQNCLCEFDKYERVRLGEGRPRSNFNGGKDG